MCVYVYIYMHTHKHVYVNNRELGTYKQGLVKGELGKKLHTIPSSTVPPQCPDMTYGQKTRNVPARNHTETFKRPAVIRERKHSNARSPG